MKSFKVQVPRGVSWRVSSTGETAPGVGRECIHVWALLFCLVALPMSLPAGPQQTPKPGAGSSLNDQELRGEGLFLQRCSVCHLPKMTKVKSDDLPSFGPSLKGLFKNSKPDKEAAVLEKIRRGSENMPGFQYGLTPSEIGDLIAYLKTL